MSSFITKEKQLLEELIKIAQNKLPPQMGLNITVVNSLLNKLENDIANPPAAEDTSPFTSGRENTQLFTKDLTSADDFMDFLNRNKITYNGMRLAYAHGATTLTADDVDFRQLSEQQRSAYVPYPQPTDAEKNDFRYYFNKDGIIAFLKYQLDQGKAKGAAAGGDLQVNFINNLINQLEKTTGQEIKPYKEVPPTDKDKTTTTTTPPGEKDTTTSKEKITQDSRNITYAVQLMPLKEDSINFNRIREFMKVMHQLDPHIISRYYQTINQALIAADAELINDTEFVLSRQWDINPRQLKNQANFCMFLKHMEDLIISIRGLIISFRDKYLDKLKEAPNLYNEVIRQGGISSTDGGSYAYQNLQLLQYMGRNIKNPCPNI